MADGIEGIIPTVVGGAVALKFIDVAMPDKKRTTRIVYVTRKKMTKKKMTKKQKARYDKLHRQHYYYDNGKLKKVI